MTNLASPIVDSGNQRAEVSPDARARRARFIPDGRGFLWSATRRALFRAAWRALVPRSKRAVSLEGSLQAAYRWLCAALDAGGDHGVAGWYSLVRGWSASYPETTGYTIPTFLTYAGVISQAEARTRAIRMADWEIEVQLPSGAVRSGLVSSKVGPAVFNTGQVLFGWISAYQATGEERYARAAQRAAEWLTREQDDDGAWRKNLSLFATSKIQTYNTRAAWGLALAGRVLHEPRWIHAARKNCDWALTQQQPNGWFRDNGFTDGEAPLLHTIGYALEGMLGVGELLNEERYVGATRSGILPLVEIHERRGTLRGRYDENWQETVSWRCLTGEAQIALILYRLAKYEQTDGFARTARAILGDLATIQDTDSPYPETRGGISGSEPLWGRYCPLAYPNWAAKFYLDALLLCLFGADVQSAPSTVEADPRLA